MVDQALGHIDQWFVEQSAEDWAPFMFGLTAEALIDYYHYVDQDERIVDALCLGADAIWEQAWIPEDEAFFYRADNPDAGGAPDLNLLIAPVYAWLYRQTGEEIYRDRGDQVFAGGVRGAWLDGYKQFNQNYRWSFDYLRWRMPGGDANLDEIVDCTDLGILATNYGSVGGLKQGDANGDGVIDVSDLGILATNYQGVALSELIPEPSGGILLITMGLVLLGFRRNA